MNAIAYFLNNPYIRLGMGIIYAGTLASPYLNSKSDSIGWVIAAAFFILATIFSMTFERKLNTKHASLLVISYTLLIVYILYNYGY